MPEVLLALDVGTSSVRAVLFALNGDKLAARRAAISTASPKPGRAEQDAEAIVRAAGRMARASLRDAGLAPADLAAIGVTTQRASVTLWDKADGRALSPLVLWSDLRGAERSAELRASGHMVAPQMAAAKLEGLIRETPGARALMDAGRLACGNIDSYLVWALTGGRVHATDRSQAWTFGYLDPATLAWNTPLLDLQGIPVSVLPNLVDTFGEIGSADAFGLGAPVTAVIADQQGAMFAHGIEPGSGKCTFGTAAAVNVSTGTQMTFGSPSVWPFVLSSARGTALYCVEAMVNAAGGGLDYVRRIFSLGDLARFNALGASAPDAAGAALLPAFSGLGAPHGDPARTGLLGGLTPAVGKPQLARAALEGLAFRVREAAVAAFAAAGRPSPDSLPVDGGLTDSDLFMQIQADLMGRALRRHAFREATACGAAVCAGLGAGFLDASDAQGFARYDRTFEPSISADEAEVRHAAWAAAVGLPSA